MIGSSCRTRPVASTAEVNSGQQPHCVSFLWAHLHISLTSAHFDDTQCGVAIGSGIFRAWGKQTTLKICKKILPWVSAWPEEGTMESFHMGLITTLARKKKSALLSMHTLGMDVYLGLQRGWATYISGVVSHTLRAGPPKEETLQAAYPFLLTRPGFVYHRICVFPLEHDTLFHIPPALTFTLLCFHHILSTVMDPPQIVSDYWPSYISR